MKSRRLTLPPDDLLNNINNIIQNLEEKNDEIEKDDELKSVNSSELDNEDEQIITNNKINNNKDNNLNINIIDEKKVEKGDKEEKGEKGEKEDKDNKENKEESYKEKKKKKKLRASRTCQEQKKVPIPEQLLNNDHLIISKFKSHFALSRPGKDEIGNTKINQDSYIVQTCINGLKDFNIFGVLDGHGIEGHLVSQFVANYIQEEFRTHPSIEKIKKTEKLYQRLIARDFAIIKDIFINADHALKDEDIDSDNSGTTCVLVIQVGHHIICANTGDSRAVLIFDENNDNNLNNIKVYPLSYDSKPENFEERKRILKMGGVVERIINKYGNGIGPYRVWVKNKDYPGLAMSRSIGDFNGKNIGIIPDPEIIECSLTIYSKYIVICSDGVWEFLSNEDIMNFGKKYYLEHNPRGFCKELIDYSTSLWKKEDVVIDDITVVAVFF